MPSRPDRIRLVSYNLKGFRGDRWVAASVVQVLRPDVLCLQEVPRLATAARRIRAFADECGMAWAGHHRRCGGTTVMITPGRPVVSVAQHRLPVRWPDASRGYAVAELAPRRGGPADRPATSAAVPPVSVVSVHLSLRAPERLAHLHTIVESLGDLRRVVLAGDLNEEPGGPVWNTLAEAGLRPVSADEPTFTARNPRWRLDGIFAGADIGAEPVEVVALGQRDLIAATDHRPIWADLILPT
ncbi:MAG: endonuclease/exonuclease/phosphatase family protein [Nostocoides sp.]